MTRRLKNVITTDLAILSADSLRELAAAGAIGRASVILRIAPAGRLAADIPQITVFATRIPLRARQFDAVRALAACLAAADPVAVIGCGSMASA